MHRSKMSFFTFKAVSDNEEEFSCLVWSIILHLLACRVSYGLSWSTRVCMMELKGPGSYIIVWNNVVPLWKKLLYLYFLWGLLSCLPYSHLWLTVALNSLCFSKPHTKITTWFFWVECRWNRRWRVIDVQGSLSFLHLVIFFSPLF